MSRAFQSSDDVHSGNYLICPELNVLAVPLRRRATKKMKGSLPSETRRGSGCP